MKFLSFTLMFIALSGLQACNGKKSETKSPEKKELEKAQDAARSGQETIEKLAQIELDLREKNLVIIGKRKGDAEIVALYFGEGNADRDVTDGLLSDYVVSATRLLKDFPEGRYHIVNRDVLEGKLVAARKLLKELRADK